MVPHMILKRGTEGGKRERGKRDGKGMKRGKGEKA